MKKEKLVNLIEFGDFYKKKSALDCIYTLSAKNIFEFELK